MASRAKEVERTKILSTSFANPTRLFSLRLLQPAHTESDVLSRM